MTAGTNMSEDRYIFKNGKALFAGIAFAFVAYIVLLAVCCVSVDVTTRFSLCVAMALLAFIINILFPKFGFYVAFMLNFVELLIHTYELLVLQKTGATELAVITLLIMVINILHRQYLAGVLKKIYMKRKAESAERAKLINKQLEDDIFARTKLIVSHETEKQSSRTASTSDPVIDNLTTLPGRAMITTRLNRLIEENLANMKASPVPDSNCTKMTVIYTSLDKESLDKLNIGHKSMDLFIQNMAHKLREAADSEDMVARIYGTEFVVLAKRAISAEDFVKYKKRLADAMLEAFKAGDDEIGVQIVFGVSVYPDDGTTAEELITRAEEAMTGRVTYGNVDVHKSIFANMPSAEIITMFESAIRSGEIHMVYQPCFTADKEICGYEAFMRWHGNDGKEIPPSDFIRAAVKCGYMRRIGNFSLEKALKTLNRLNVKNPNLTMTINISNDQLKDPEFVVEFSNALSNSGAELSNVILDISEESLFTELPDIKASIEKLSAMGVTMALDNFGRGYSSFNAIPLLPISTLKLDGNFTGNLTSDINVRVLSSAAVSLMHDIDIKVCATGVGDLEQLYLLKEYGCDYFQGACLGVPVNEADLLK